MASLTHILSQIGSGALSPQAAIDASATAVAQRDGEIGAFVRTLPDPRAGSGPLAGIAVGIKDIIDTADLATEMGCPAIYGGWQPRADAPVVARLRTLGATILGKTATTAFAAMDPAATRNPHDPARTPGGSSSGSAAAVAAGMIPLALGTQTAGSVIRPATYCGVAAIKPSFRLLPTVGVKPSAWTLDTVGVFAQGVADVAVALEWLSGRPMPLADMAVPLRFGVVRAEHAGTAEPEAEAALSRATALLVAAGHLVVPLRLPEICAEAQAAQLTLQNYEMAQAMAWEWLAMRHALPPRIGEALDAAQAIGAADYDRARGTARQARLAVRDTFREIDVILTFAAPGIAPDRATTGDPRFNRLWTLLGVPCVAVPGLRAGRMPVGLQVVGPFARDAATLAAALALERLLAAAPDL